MRKTGQNSGSKSKVHDLFYSSYVTHDVQFLQEEF